MKWIFSFMLLSSAIIFHTNCQILALDDQIGNNKIGIDLGVTGIGKNQVGIDLVLKGITPINIDDYDNNADD